MANERYLTKSRFKLACECPTKLYYTNKNEYADQKIDDLFLLALADGGFQVGELAKSYFPGGHEIGRGNYAETARVTRELIENGDVVIYEAAFQTGSYFIYADIVERKDDTLFIYEVKAKSIDPENDRFLKKKGTGLLAAWEPYLLDIAFQRMVVQKAFPDLNVSAHLMMADKTSRCPTDGLNQKFRVKRTNDGSMEVIVGTLTAEDLAERILHIVNVDDICEMIYDGRAYSRPDGLSFEGAAEAFAAAYSTNSRLDAEPTKSCRDCEFRTTPEERVRGLKDGFRECWSNWFGWTDDDFEVQSVLDIWNFRGKDKLIAEGRVSIASVTPDDIGEKESDKPGLSDSQRQWMQVDKAQRRDFTVYLDKEGLEAEFESLQYPLHFIDFETSMPAIPFNKGRRPYEGIAFQFSHHVVFDDGRVEHANEFLLADPGKFPSYEFIRKLRDALADVPGSIFQYSNFENTYLNFIYLQLSDDPSIEDRDELIDFIRTISRSKSGSPDYWVGDRNMVDMLQLVKRYYYDPLTEGSNSIKQVLPAVMERSSYLQEKYSKPIYGAEGGIVSRNFKDWTWLKLDKDGRVIDPYKSLPRMFEGVSDEDFDSLMADSDEIREGGAALTAYAKLQFQEMTDYERTEIEKALLKYCELDTLAMVMIYEAWREMLR